MGQASCGSQKKEKSTIAVFRQKKDIRLKQIKIFVTYKSYTENVQWKKRLSNATGCIGRYPEKKE